MFLFYLQRKKPTYYSITRIYIASHVRNIFKIIQIVETEKSMGFSNDSPLWVRHGTFRAQPALDGMQIFQFWYANDVLQQPLCLYNNMIFCHDGERAREYHEYA